MAKIFKYIPGHVIWTMPVGRVLLVAQQYGSGLPFLWIEVEDDAKLANYYIIGTGQDAPVGTTHVGSAICNEFVWHVYRE